MLKTLKIMLGMIKIEHTLFALPFLYSGAFLASKGFPSLHIFIWITTGLFSARSAAMLLNRLIDKDIDAKNSRTKDRALARGLIEEKEVIFVVVACLGVFFIATFELNMLCVKLYPFAVALFVIYPYLKRFTYLSHIVLGAILSLAPIGGWIAVKESFSVGIILLSVAVLFWVAGFDIIYACQDIEFDRKLGLFSIPAKFGLKKALLFSSFFHLLTALFLLGSFFMLHLSNKFLVCISVITMLLIYEHLIAKPNKLDKVQVAFFNINAIISSLFLLASMLEVFNPFTG